MAEHIRALLPPLRASAHQHTRRKTVAVCGVHASDCQLAVAETMAVDVLLEHPLPLLDLVMR